MNRLITFDQITLKRFGIQAMLFRLNLYFMHPCAHWLQIKNFHLGQGVCHVVKLLPIFNLKSEIANALVNYLSTCIWMYLIALEMYVCVLNIYEFKSSNLFICVRPRVDDLLIANANWVCFIVLEKYVFFLSTWLWKFKPFHLCETKCRWIF